VLARLEENSDDAFFVEVAVSDKKEGLDGGTLLPQFCGISKASSVYHLMNRGER
jgi:hypothetical protein